jgi:hypothetical protein
VVNRGEDSLQLGVEALFSYVDLAPPVVILTPLGESLRPVMIAMCAWGETYGRRENAESSQARAYLRGTPAHFAVES